MVERSSKCFGKQKKIVTDWAEPKNAEAPFAEVPPIPAIPKYTGP
jgi:hypothetical protein